MRSVSTIIPVVKYVRDTSHVQRSHVTLSRISTLPALSVKKKTEHNGKSMVHVLYILRFTSQVEATSNSKEIKPVPISIVELCLAEGIG